MTFNHFVRVGDFTGEAELTPGALNPASLRMRLRAAAQHEAKIGGDLTLHGVTRHIVIPSMVLVSGSDLRARGEFNETIEFDRGVC